MVASSQTPLVVDHVIDLSGATPTDTHESLDVQATISVGGDLDGQVAVGNNIVQVRIDTVHGDLITVAPNSSAPTVERRELPVRLLPRRPATFLDRETETARIIDSLLAADVIGIEGREGVGKSALLRHTAHQPRLEPAPAGVIHLSCAGDREGDVARSLFDAFFVTSAPYQPSRGELRQRLDGVQAALLLDDVGLSSDEIDRLLDLMPRSGFALASEHSVVSSSLTLGSLPRADAAALVQKAEVVDETTAARIAAMPGASPQQLLRASAQATDAALDEDAHRALRLLAAIPGMRLDAGQIAQLGVGDGSARVVELLMRRGLLSRHASRDRALERYSLASQDADATPQGDVAAARQQLYDHFQAWGQQHRHAVPVPSNDVEAARQVMSDAARRRRWDLAATLALALESSFAVAGRWDAWSDTLHLLQRASLETGAEDIYAFALHQQGVLAICSGHTAMGLASLERALQIRERLGDHRGAEITRANLRLFTPPPSPPSSPGPLRRMRLLLGTLFVLAAVIAALYAAEAWPFDPRPPNGEVNSLGADPSPLEFGEVEIDTSRSESIVLSNTGESRLEVSEATIADSTAFTIDTEMPITLAADASRQIEVAFAPTSEGTETATLTLEHTSASSPLAIELTGTGTEVETPAAPPVVDITSGPQGTTEEPDVTFEFISDTPNATFECRLVTDSLSDPELALGPAEYESCSSPHPLNDLTDGTYTFEVRATANGSTGDPATRTWTITSPRPVVEIESGPQGTVATSDVRFTFTSIPPNATFECRLDLSRNPDTDPELALGPAEYEPCSSSYERNDLPAGDYIFAVRATANGVTGDPTTRTWTISPIG